MNKRRKRAARKIRGLPQQSTISGSLGSGSFDDSLSVAVSDEKMSPRNRAQNLEYCERIDLISEMEENEDWSKVKLKVFFWSPEICQIAWIFENFWGRFLRFTEITPIYDRTKN